jgi:hypothetical protein
MLPLEWTVTHSCAAGTAAQCSFHHSANHGTQPLSTIALSWGIRQLGPALYNLWPLWSLLIPFEWGGGGGGALLLDSAPLFLYSFNALEGIMEGSATRPFILNKRIKAGIKRFIQIFILHHFLIHRHCRALSTTSNCHIFLLFFF